MAISYQNRQIIKDRIKKREPFNYATNGMKAEIWTYNPPKGRLPDFLGDQLNGVIATQGSAYIVYSYHTPIGWTTGPNEKDWFIPTVYYSTTTTHHQTILRIAI